MQQYNFEEYKNDPRAGARGYRGIRVSGAQIFLTSSIGKQYVGDEPTNVGVEYDLENKVIRLTLQTGKPIKGQLPLRSGVSYAYYVPARLTEVGLPQGRYYLRDEKTEKKGGHTRHKLLFSYAEDNQ
jgi:hypothetical protein